MSKRIIVIDDSALVLNWVRMNLSPMGFEVTTTNSPFDTQSMVQRVKPDLVLLDVGMAGLTGDALCKMMKDSDNFKENIIILYSSLPEDELRSLAEECGANGYIHKTDDVSDLAERINHALEKATGEDVDPNRKTRIAVVDDSPIALMWVRENMGSRGYDINTWDSPVGAQELVERNHPDVILLDVRMPIQTGDKLCRMFKENPKTSHIPIILYSDTPEDELEALAQAAGADGYIVKSDDPEAVAIQLSAVLGDDA
jgi:two-component system OmpR family response regulator